MIAFEDRSISSSVNDTIVKIEDIRNKLAVRNQAVTRVESFQRKRKNR